ncbi:IPT/TIG domain protein [Trichuris suis]|nr:IPT/TIG domain protein [Trichuris suis]
MKSDPPLVTGLSPKEGPPGTQIIIRGENLGLSQSDVVGLIVCSMDCLASMRWESPHKIIARVTQSKAGIGDVTVITKSGGRGSCLVQFRIFHALIGPLQESAVWVDESHFVDSMRSAAEEMNVVIEDSPLTISKDSATTPVPERVMEVYADSGSNLRLENFHPVRYLLENYRTASYDSLEAALFHLENHSNLAQKEPKNFLKSNLSCILDCVDALCDLRDFIGSSEQPDYSKMLSTLRHQISVCSSCGEEVFVDVLKRKEQSDSIRNALTVLRRFRFLFLLPQAMKSHVEKGEYGLVTSEYSRAKSLLCETEVPLLKEGLRFAFAEADAQMEKLKMALYERLSDPTVSLNEQKKIIRYLLTVDQETDAEKESRYEDSDRDYSTELLSEVPPCFLFCDVICSVLASRLPEILKLSEEYLSGQLTARGLFHSESEIEEMIVDIIDLCVALMLNAVLPSALPPRLKESFGGVLASWKPLKTDSFGYIELLSSLRTCLLSLYKMDCSDQYLSSLLTACMELRVTCLKLVASQASHSICELASKETWKLSECDKDMSKTALPDMFESIVNEVQPIVNTFLSYNNFPHEKDLLQLEAYRPSVLRSLECLFCSFKITLERLINFEPSENPPTALRRPSTLKSSFDKGKRAPKLTEKKLLVVVANCDYVLRFCLPRLFERASKCGVWLIEPIQERCIVCYGSFRTTLLKHYISSKCPPLGLSSQIVGKEDDDVKSVSTYIKDCILRVVAVQAELFLVCPVLYHTVIGFVVKNYHDRITEHAKERLDTMSPQQRSQVLLDLTAFEESVKSFLSAETLLAIRNFKVQIGAPWTESLQLLLDNYLSKEELLISCLGRVAPASDT